MTHRDYSIREEWAAITGQVTGKCPDKYGAVRVNHSGQVTGECLVTNAPDALFRPTQVMVKLLIVH